MTLKKQLSKIDINIVLIIVFVAFICFYGYLDPQNQSFVAHDEGLYVGRAKRIIDAKDWFTPFHYPHHKTIGSYWLISICIKFLGISEFSARFPSGLFSILSSICVYLTAKEFISKGSSLLAAILLPSMPLWYQYSRYASPDIPFVFFVLISSYCLIKSYSQFNFRTSSYEVLLFFSGFFIGIAFLVRSFMVFIPIFGLIPYFLSIKNFWTKINIRLFLFGLLVGLIPSMLAIIISLHHYGIESIYSLTDFVKYKTAGGSFTKSLFFYPLNIIILSLPLSLLSTLGIEALLDKKDKVRNSYFILYPLIILGILVFISSRHSHYTLILYPHIAFFFGFAAERLKDKGRKLSRKMGIQLAILFFTIGLMLSLLLIASKFSIGSISIDLFNTYEYPIVLLSLIYLLFSSTFFLRQISSRSQLMFFVGICALQITALTYLYGNGIMGNPNTDFKSFAKSEIINKLSNSNIIYLYQMNGKVRTLSQVYFPSYKHISNSLQDLPKPSYVMIENNELAKIVLIQNENKEFSLEKIANYKDWNMLRLD